MSSLLDQPVRSFLDQLAARTPAPGGGGAAAVTGAMAAGLVAMAARFSARQLPEAGDLADQADRWCRQAAAMADMDARAYQAVLDAGPGYRPEALLGAALVPLEIAGIGARVAQLGLQVAEAGNPNLRGDAVTGALLAAASARSAACLVDINVRLGGLDPELSQRAAQAAADAGDAAGRAAMSAERAADERLSRRLCHSRSPRSAATQRLPAAIAAPDGDAASVCQVSSASVIRRILPPREPLSWAMPGSACSPVDAQSMPSGPKARRPPL
ncbi:MAG TPA: cyclodeaminase/cyclohydrolase family protein [Streptosporangiaceae bacterium]|nr:cyclodeaminase/cyclohydrolase family protein [Streptosporangiaceae bacterium]